MKNDLVNVKNISADVTILLDYLKNNGQKDQYFCADHHEAIISHEDFELATRLLEQHSIEKGIVKGSDRYQQRYAFSSNIICNECGSTSTRN